MLPVDQALTHLPALALNEAESLLIQQGQRLALEKNTEPGLYRLYKNINEQAQFMGMGELSNNVLRVKRLLAY